MDSPVHDFNTANTPGRHSSYLESCTGWLKDHAPEIVEKIIQSGAIKHGEKIRIVSIGSGKGYTDAVFLDKILQFKIPVHYTAVDCNEDMMKHFHNNVACNPLYTEVEFDLKRMTSEEFLSHGASELKFHVALFLSSLYYFKGCAGTVLRKYHDMTVEGGCILAITAAERGVWQYVVNTYKGILPGGDLLFAEGIEPELLKENLEFTHTYFDYIFDIGPIVQNTVDGNYLLDLLTHVNQFRRTSPPALVVEFLNGLKHAAIPEGDKLILTNRCIVHMIEKRQLSALE